MSHRDRELTGQLISAVLKGQLTRREVFKRAAALGLSAASVGALMAACGTDPIDDVEVDDEDPDDTDPDPAVDDPDDDEDDEDVVDEEPADIPDEAPDLDLEIAVRERTLIVMQGGADGQNPEYENFNLQVPGGNDGWHSGPLQTMSEPLIMFNVLTGEYENWLAEDWEYNDDFTEITMTLREGIEWHDGTPFTAEDVAFTYNLVRDHQDEATHGAEIHFLEEAVVIDERTLRFELNASNPRWWVTTLTSNHGVTEQIFPKHIWEDKEFSEFTFFDPDEGWPIGTGPYTLTSTSLDQKVFDRYDDWWAARTGFKELPQVERVIYIPMRDESLSAAMLIANEIDMSRILSVPTLETTFVQNPDIITFSHQDPPYGYLDWCPIDLGFNCSVEPWDNADLRWAINHVIDRERLVNLAEAGAGVVALHQFTPYEWFEPFEQAIQPILDEHGLTTEPNMERSEELMEGMGYEMNGQGLWVDENGDTLEINFFVPEYLRAYGPPLSQMLRDGGFDASFDMSPGLASQVNTGDHPEWIGCKGPSGVFGMDPFYMLSIYTSEFYRPTGEPAATGSAIARWQNEEFDQIVRQMDPLDPDDPETLDHFTQAMDIWVRELPAVFVAQLIIRYPMSTGLWTGWPTEDDVYGFPHTWQQEFMKTIIRLEPTS